MSTNNSKTAMTYHICSHYSGERRVTVAPLEIYPESQYSLLTGADFHDTLPLRKVKRRVGRT